MGTKDFSLARALNPTVLPKEGYGVRSPFQELSFLVAPPQRKTKKKVNLDRLRFNLESRIDKHPRFKVPAFDLGLWMADEKLNIKSVLKSQNLKKLGRKIQADFILVPSVRSVKGKMALNYKLISTADGSLKKQANIMSEDMPGGDKPRERAGGRTQTRFAKKEEFFKFVRKMDFPYEIIDMDVGDLNGNGTKEIVLIDRYRVMIFENKKGTLRRLSTVKTNKISNKFLGVDVGDINGNGRDEIFVTNQVGDKLESFALESRPKKKGFHYMLKDANLYFRIIRPMGKRPVLLSQSPGFRNPFNGPIKITRFKRGKYRQVSKLNTPEIYGTHFVLYGLTQEDLNGDGTQETIILDNNYHLRVYSSEGRVIVKSGQYYGHDPRLIEVGIVDGAEILPDLGDPVPFKGRLEFVKVGGNRFLFLPRNYITGDGKLTRLILVENSGLSALRLTGEGFESAFESNPQKGYLGAFRVVPNKNGAGATVYVLRIEKEFFKQAGFSTLSIYSWLAE